MTKAPAKLNPTIIKGHLSKLLLIPILCFIGAALGYFLPVQWKAEMVAKSALPVTLIVLIAIGFSLHGFLKQTDLKAAFKRHLPILVLSGIVILFYSLVDHRANKVILDELVLQTSALQLTENNEYRVPQFAHNLQNDFSLHLGVPDKRPPLFPVLLSLAHRLLGYHPGNGFLLNAALGFFLFVTLGKIGILLFPQKGEYISILGFASLPLVSQNVTSQHLEILYLFLIALLFWIALKVVTRKRDQEIPIAYLVATCIALTRYEGLIFFMVPFFLHAHAVLHNRPVSGLRWVYWVCPLSIIFIFSLLGHVFHYSEFWQLETMNSPEPFGLQYWQPNIGALFDFMLSINREFAGSFPLSMIGLASVPVSLFWIGKNIFNKTKGESDPEEDWFPLGLFFLGALLFLGLIFSYHWGHVNSHVTARFLLFPYLVLAGSALYSLRKEPFWVLLFATLLTLFCGIEAGAVEGQSLNVSYVLALAGFSYGALVCLKKRALIQLPFGLVVFLGIYLITETMPAIQQRTYEDAYLPMPRVQIFFEWIEKYSGNNAVFAAESSLYGMLAKESSTSITRFERDPETLLSLVRTGRFSDIYILQVVLLDSKGKYHASEKWTIPDAVLYETVESRRITDDLGVRMIRVIRLQRGSSSSAATPSEEPEEAEAPMP